MESEMAENVKRILVYFMALWLATDAIWDAKALALSALVVAIALILYEIHGEPSQKPQSEN